MAIRYAVANGNWSALTTWDGGASLPGSGDTAYLNGKTVAIDQNIDLSYAGAAVSASAMVPGHCYEIVTPGDTLWSASGARNAEAGTQFITNGPGTGTGTCVLVGCIASTPYAPLSILTSGGITLAAQTRTIIASLWSGTATPFVAMLSMSVGCVIVGSVHFGAVTGSAVPAISITAATNAALHITGDVAPVNVVALSMHGVSAGSAPMGAITVRGNVYGPKSGGVNASIHAYGDVTVYGDLIPSVLGGDNGECVRASGAGSTVVINGNILAGAAVTGPALDMQGSGSVLTVNGSVAGGAGIGIAQGSGILYATVNGSVTGGTAKAGIAISQGTVTVHGDMYAGAGAPAVDVIGALPTCEFYGDVYASSASPALTCGITNANLHTLQGNEYDHANGTVAAHLNRRRLGSNVPGLVRRLSLDGDSTFVTRRVQVDPAPSVVVEGHSYAGGSLVGTFKVPAASQVAAGVPVGATVGTAEFSQDVPTAAEVASAVRTNLSAELVSLDAPVSDVPAAVRAELAPELSRAANCATVGTVGAALAAYESV